jgi:GH15 family glucan-1,4-alpha-glucosidase
LATIGAIEGGWADERGLLLRYRGGDGIDAPEGSFLLCTFWLTHALSVAFSNLGLVTAAQALTNVEHHPRRGGAPLTRAFTATTKP